MKALYIFLYTFFFHGISFTEDDLQILFYLKALQFLTMYVRAPSEIRIKDIASLAVDAIPNTVWIPDGACTRN